ncbi:hypothetical protein D9M68_980270 [compost metagenome]
MQGIDVHQRAVGTGATWLQLFRRIAGGFQRCAVIGLEQALASAQGQGNGGHGGSFEKRHGRPSWNRERRKVTRFDCQQDNQFATKLIRVLSPSAVHPDEWKGAASKGTGALGWREAEVGTSY